MYKILFDKDAGKFIEKLPNNIGTQILKKIDSSAEEPFLFFERLSGRQEFKLRIGKYRVIADISRNEQTISIRKIGLRKNIYD